MALNTLANITQNEIEYARLCNEIKSQLDWRTGLVHAERKGLEEGFTRGHDEGRIEGLTEGINRANFENAQKMKNMGFSAEQIQAVTGLSIETISHLK